MPDRQMERFKTKKSLGQNFLQDGDAIEKIADACGAGPEDLVIEIGPGMGVLTEALAERAGKVAAVELDDRLIPILRERFAGADNVTIIHEDILKADLRGIIKDSAMPGSVKIVGNLPYYITTPILLGLLEQDVPAESITAMVQKEVAERIVAGPGGRDYGVLSVSLQYYCTAEYVLDVPAESFKPVPKVDSAVVKLTLRDRSERLPEAEEKQFFETVKRSFAQRRKTLGNSLAGFCGSSKEQAAEALRSAGIAPERRAETLSIEEFEKAARAFAKLK